MIASTFSAPTGTPNQHPARPPRVLSIAGTDPSGGAGIQADLKSIAALGGYGMAAITSLVAQNTHGIRSIHTPPVSFLREQLDAVSDDIHIDAVKIGMLGTVEVTAVVGDWLAAARPPIVVLDPVMVATSGDRLLAPGAEDALRTLLPESTLVTPNLPELAVLAGEERAESWANALNQARRVSAHYGVTVLAKGGHLVGDHCPDALVDERGFPGGDTLIEVSGPRLTTRNTHGTGCSLSSALATAQARNNDWALSLRECTAWLRDSITHADDLEVGSGNGPINHFHTLWSAATR
ncbi:hypothetical protein GCM10022198_07860 [Klugiella xanthotipulae]|uniref:Hydroxymethylpyrimidine kinase/phosphomethylpyrimidine kinase n=1 Tax=Klugiella xanthotipulae TaxID=244735 RepID=A0A543HT52_9MICO|nr:hydroxymethylpyrimidine kinase/phosphomethylpyrimidine kinase [Klugiella xanthotipulae]